MTAANGLEGVLAAHNLRPTVILMDVTMPVLNGIEATRLLKSSAATRGVSVIAHTARPNFSDGAAVLFAGVLTKPVTPEKIVASVRELVDGTSAPE
jgi:CheY-like chemotaxis protein